MKLSESKDDIFYRFDQPNGFWYELAYFKARKRFFAFRCNAFLKDPYWEKMDASSMRQAKQGSLRLGDSKLGNQRPYLTALFCRCFRTRSRTWV